MAANLVQVEAELQLLLGGQVILTSGTKRRRRQIEDIFSWVEAFTLFAMVLTSYLPHRWRDLPAYKLLILLTNRQFAGRVWLRYDQAFREHTAAMKLIDWSSTNVQLCNFHAAGASTHSSSEKEFPQSMEVHFHSPRGWLFFSNDRLQVLEPAQMFFALHCVQVLPLLQ